MKLFTKEIEQQLQSQYEKGSDLEGQEVVAKIFNPYGAGTWYLLNQDPEDPDYIWCIAKLFEVEIGSVSKSEIENLRVNVFGVQLGLERDLYFKPINAKECYDRLIKGNHI